jgi:site-specific recombinase XerD
MTVAQQGCRDSLSYSPRVAPTRAQHDQRKAGRGKAPCIRGRRFRPAECGLSCGICRVKGAKCLGVRLGNWLTATQARALWQVPDPSTLKGKRDRALLGILLGCGLRRREAAELEFAHIQQREGHWAIVDLVGKGRHIRTVPVPDWVKIAIDAWCESAGVSGGRVFRCVCRAGKTWGTGVTERVVWHVVKNCAKRAGIDKRLCRDAEGELGQIQFLLGHVSVQTTEKYLGCTQRTREAVNDRIGIEPTDGGERA